MNPMDMLKNLQNLQQNVGEMQEVVKKIRATGSSGGDLVKVTVDGTMEALSVQIDPIAVDPRDIRMLEELVAAAFTDAIRKIKPLLQEEVSRMAGGINLPPDFLGQFS